MASETLELALGHQHTYEYAPESDRIHRVSGRKRRTLYRTSSNRPLYVSQVEVQEAKGIRSGKRALLVLYGDAVALLSGSLLDQSRHSVDFTAGGDGAADRVPALKFLAYSEVLSVSPKSSNSIEIEYVSVEDKPKLAVGNLLDLLNEQRQQQQQQSGDSSESDTEPSSSSNVVISSSSSIGNHAGSSTSVTAAAATASARVTYNTLLLGFANPAAAAAAAAALLYYRAQAAAAVHWLSEGLHLGFKCVLVSAEALPLHGSSGSSSSSGRARSGSTMWRAVSLARRSSAGVAGLDKGALAAAGSSGSSSSSGGVRYPWICQPGLAWNCQVPLPGSWDTFITSVMTGNSDSNSNRGNAPSNDSNARSRAPGGTASTAAAAAAAADKDITLDDLACRIDLKQGPQAVVISFTTPYGLAAATVTPQIVRAAVLNSECRQVLAIPVTQDSNSSSSSGGDSHNAVAAAPVVGFPLSVHSAVGSSSSSSSGRKDPTSASRLKAPAGAAAAAAAAAAPGVPAKHEMQVYAMLAIQIVKTPDAAGQAAAAAQFDPMRQQQQQQQRPQQQLLPAVEAPAPAPPAPAAAAAPASRLASMMPIAAAGGLTARQLQLIRLTVYVLLAALLCSTSSSSSGQLSGVVLLQLLLLLCVAAADIAPLWREQQQQQLGGHLSSASSLQQQPLPDAGAAAAADKQITKLQLGSTSSTVGTPKQSAFATAAATAPPFSRQQSVTAGPTAAAAAGGECTTAGGWSILLIEGDVTSTPSPFLQLQIAALSCDQQTADLRAQLSTSRSSTAATAAAVAAAAAGGHAHGQQGAEGLTSLLEIDQDDVDKPESVRLPVLISDPEPTWLDYDTKLRFINAKPTLEASRQQALETDNWRKAEDVDNTLRRPAPTFATVGKVLPFYVLGKTDDKNAIICIKLGCTKALCDAIFHNHAFTLDDLALHLTFINEYLTKVVAPGPLPAGNQVLLFDLSGLKLSHVMNEQAYGLFQVLLRFGTYYPEHLHQAIIMHAPAWFNIPWKMVATFLDANTRSKIVVVGSPKSALKSLIKHFQGVENVPAEWGGNCSTPLEQYSEQQKMMDFIAKLNAQG